MKKEYDFSKGRRGPVIKPPPGKTRITIRLDADVLDWFRQQVDDAGGGNYQTLINGALRSFMRQKQEPLETTLRRVIRDEIRRAGVGLGGDPPERPLNRVCCHDEVTEPRPDVEHGKDEQMPAAAGAVLGIDVGFSERHDTTCLCLLEWSGARVRLDFQKVGTDSDARCAALTSLIRKPIQLAAVAIDGPLAQGLRIVPHYRTAEALLSRGVFQKRGKPGQTSSPTGQLLHRHATELANLVLAEADCGRFPIAPATHIEPISDFALVEAFPNQFLAALIDEDSLPQLDRDASDRYWEHLADTGGLDRLLEGLLPGHRFEIPPGDIRDHDKRAAVVCALTALSVARRNGVGVGDPVDGDIFLPPVQLWGKSISGASPWMEAALRENLPAVRRASKPEWVNHKKARVRLHRSYCNW